jgi:hypothetical protein
MAWSDLAALNAAYAKVEQEQRCLAENNLWERGTLAVYQRLHRLSLYSSACPVWMMDHADRGALALLCCLINPRIVIEVGTRFGGSALFFAQHAEKVYCIDFDEAVMDRCRAIGNIEVIIGRSTEEIPKLLHHLRSNGYDFDIAFVDGDHTDAGVRADIEAFIAQRPLHSAWLACHDSFNPAVRSGIKGANWDRPWVRNVEIDFAPGNLKSDPYLDSEMWGGIAIAELHPNDRSGELQIGEECKTLYEAAYQHSIYNKLNPMTRLRRKVIMKAEAMGLRKSVELARKTRDLIKRIARA